MKKDLEPSENAAADDLFVMMQRAHTEDPASKFVRDIKDCTRASHCAGS